MNDVAPAHDRITPLPSSVQTLAELTRALSHECELVLALDTALQEQRASVASGSPAQIHASADAIGRALHTLEEAKRRRSGLVSDLTGRSDTPLEHIETSYATALPAEFRERRRSLRAAAQQATQSAAINRSVLRHVIDAGEAYLQALFSSGDPAGGYGPAERRDDGTAGAILNRRA
jgi:FlgN protein